MVNIHNCLRLPQHSAYHRNFKTLQIPRPFKHAQDVNIRSQVKQTLNRSQQIVVYTIETCLIQNITYTQVLSGLHACSTSPRHLRKAFEARSNASQPTLCTRHIFKHYMPWKAPAVWQHLSLQFTQVFVFHRATLIFEVITGLSGSVLPPVTPKTCTCNTFSALMA